MAAKPAFIEPMLATRVAKLPEGPDWEYEVKPQLVAEIKFTEWTSGNVLRHAEYAGLRDDKDPSEVVKEMSSPPS
jgi:bifunctional non-homologous end joining protein LigD